MNYNRFLVLVPIVSVVFGFVLGKIGASQVSLSDFSISQLFNIFIITAFFLLVIRGVAWFVIFRLFDISSVYPFMSVSYVVILFVSNLFFNESLTFNKLLGTFFIILGAFLVNKGNQSGGGRC